MPKYRLEAPLNDLDHRMSYAQSRIPESAQTGPHPGLGACVLRHIDHPFLKPFAAFSEGAYAQSLAGWDRKAPLILDAGCGVGHSTFALARQFPDHWVIGVDQSQKCLERPKPYAHLPENAVLVRADLVDYWRLLAQGGHRLARHYLLYPNPWPKIGHLQRRWHAHPVFPLWRDLGGLFECRTNWQVYAEECRLALHLLTGQTPGFDVFIPSEPLTPFERKYHDSGQTLYRVWLASMGGLSGCNATHYDPRA
jgi:tRNA (guanine-N7-)-methyltransferase